MPKEFMEMNQAQSASNEADAAQHAASLSAAWRRRHTARAKAINVELTRQYVDADAAERLLLRLVSHDVALAETLGHTELQLAQRALALVDNVSVGLALARTLRQVAVVREGTTRRIQDLLQATRVLRGQRRLAETPGLRRVA